MIGCDPDADRECRDAAVAEVFEYEAAEGRRWRPVCLAHLVEHCTTVPMYVWHALGDETPVRAAAVDYGRKP